MPKLCDLQIHINEEIFLANEVFYESISVIYLFIYSSLMLLLDSKEINEDPMSQVILVNLFCRRLYQDTVEQ